MSIMSMYKIFKKYISNVINNNFLEFLWFLLHESLLFPTSFHIINIKNESFEDVSDSKLERTIY